MARAPGSATGRTRDAVGVTASPGDVTGVQLWVTKTDTRAQQMQRRHPSRQSSALDPPVLSVQPSGAITVSSSVDWTAKTASHKARKSRTRQTISRTPRAVGDSDKDFRNSSGWLARQPARIRYLCAESESSP